MGRDSRWITNLVINDVVVTFVHTSSVWTVLKGFGYVLDIRDAVDDDTTRPFFMSVLNTVQINYTNSYHTESALVHLMRPDGCDIGNMGTESRTYCSSHYKDTRSRTSSRDNALRNRQQEVSPIS